MATFAKQAQVSRYRVTQVIAFLYSILFVSIIAGGYFFLLQKNYFVATLFALVFAGIAWNIARYLGSSEKGIQGYPPLFALLLIISGVGVFNNLILNLEGRQIFQETLNETELRFTELAEATAKYAQDPTVAARLAKIDSLIATLISEIQNPRNCGQGPQALQIAFDIQKELPDFRLLSGKSDCSMNNVLAAEYRETLEGLKIKAAWYVEADYGGLVKTREEIIENAAAAKAELKLLRSAVNTGFAGTLLKSVGPKLEDLASMYREDAARLRRYSSGEDVAPALNLSAVESLGEWSQLINLVISRANKASTYVYLSLAVFLDWIMVYLFTLIRQNGAGLNLRAGSVQGVRNPWGARS
jgi:hypothetical protein